MPSLTSPRLASHLSSVLPSDSRTALRESVLPTLLQSIASIARALQQAHDVTLAGTANTFGDDQLNVDVLAEEALRAAIRTCPAIVTASSEEDPVERSSGAPRPATGDKRRLDDEQYTVAFDPLDGSSIIAPNWSVGTIIGVWDGPTAVGQDPVRNQVAAILGVLGPRTTAYVALRLEGTAPTCFEVAIGADGSLAVVRPTVRLATPPFSTRYFAPANLRAAAENPRYMELVTQYITNKYTLRYSGGLVPDVVHALTKGHGIYLSPVTGASKAKLRRLYELFPIALVVECAGGAAVDPADGRSVLGHVLRGTDERAGLICGTAEEVGFATRALLG